jgi:uncharacterized protein YndB with AHSA1/START domain
MAHDSLRLIAILPAAPDRVYSAWLDAKEHSEFTGDDATSEPGVGGRHTAWGGYISGRHVELVKGRKIVQTWRTTEFPEDAPDSRLELIFESKGSGQETVLTLIHTEIPVGQGDQYRSGWGEHYFEPLRAYFHDLARKPTSKAPAKAPAPAAKAASPKNAAPTKKAAPKKAAPKKAAPKKAAPKKKAALQKKAAPKKAAPKKGVKPAKRPVRR